MMHTNMWNGAGERVYAVSVRGPEGSGERARYANARLRNANHISLTKLHTRCNVYERERDCRTANKSNMPTLNRCAMGFLT